MLNMHVVRYLFVSTFLLLTPIFAVAEEPINVDPWEGFNRAMFSFNDTLDRYALKPAAQGYKAITPDLVETGVSNFFGNLSDIGSMVNNLLQLKGNAAGQDLGRVIFNSTVGLGGVIDIATPMGLPEHNEDFGQTLGYWGVDTGPYLVLPLLGPSNIRDGIGRIPDSMVDPVGEVNPIRTRNQLTALRIIDTRAGLFAAEELLTGDGYTAMRDAYMQRREFLVNDGKAAAFDQDQF
jgi:phospholipid-binding lipoprotein MlaA